MDGGRRGAALSEAADQESGVAAVAACRAAEPTSDRSFTACRTKIKHGGSVSMPYEELPRELPCESTARERRRAAVGRSPPAVDGRARGARPRD
jgi:hypothetical protein